jgi:hypothetical protein
VSLERIDVRSDGTETKNLLRFDNVSENSVDRIRNELVPWHETAGCLFVHPGSDEN